MLHSGTSALSVLVCSSVPSEIFGLNFGRGLNGRLRWQFSVKHFDKALSIVKSPRWKKLSCKHFNLLVFSTLKGVTVCFMKEVRCLPLCWPADDHRVKLQRTASFAHPHLQFVLINTVLILLVIPSICIMSKEDIGLKSYLDYFALFLDDLKHLQHLPR